MILDELRAFYENQGLTSADYHIGPEHPGLEEKAIQLIQEHQSPKILEIGYQSGGFSAPIILNLCGKRGFSYEGIDNMQFNELINSKWHTGLLTDFLLSKGVDKYCFNFHIGDSGKFLKRCNDQYDFILIDHLKVLYPRELKMILKKRLIKKNGVIFLHDVLSKAREAWQKCSKICDAYRCPYEIDESIISGLAILRPDLDRFPKGIRKLLASLFNSFDKPLVSQCDYTRFDL